MPRRAKRDAGGGGHAGFAGGAGVLPRGNEHRFQRALRRELARERLAELAPGGTPDRPIVVGSAAVIEPRVAALACPHCEGRYRVLEHTRPYPGRRRVDVACRHCSTPRTLWFRIVEREAN